MAADNNVAHLPEPFPRNSSPRVRAVLDFDAYAAAGWREKVIVGPGGLCSFSRPGCHGNDPPRMRTVGCHSRLIKVNIPQKCLE